MYRKKLKILKGARATLNPLVPPLDKRKKKTKRKKERNSLDKGREKGKFKKSSKREERKERGNQSLKKVYLLTQKHLMNCEFEIDDCLMID